MKPEDLLSRVTPAISWKWRKFESFLTVWGGELVWTTARGTIWELRAMWLQIALLVYSFTCENCLYWAVAGSVGCYIGWELRISRANGLPELIRNAILWIGRLGYDWYTEKTITVEGNWVLIGQLCACIAWLHSEYRGKWELLSTCLDGVVIISKKSTVLAANGPAMKLLKCSTLHQIELLFSSTRLFERFSAVPTCIQDTFLVPDSTIELRAVPYPSQILLFLRDFSHFAALRSQVQLKHSQCKTLLSSVSHQLRTPINAIVNICEELEDSTHLSRKELATLRILSSSSKFLLSNVNDFMDCALLESGKFELRKGPFRLEEAVKECVGLIEEQCLLKGLSLVVRYDRQLPIIAYSDRSRLKQVLLNILSNALKFTLKGCIEVAVLCTNVHQIRVIVKDTGIGIPQKAFQSLLNRLRTAADYSLGLGLTNALVVALGGKPIQVRSQQGRGSEFQFDVDIGEFSISPTERLITGDQDESCYSEDLLSPQQLPYTQFHSTDQAQVLIVDDSEFNRLVLQRLLQANGYKCHQAFTGLQALIAVRKQALSGCPYKVVLMDLDMPEMDGITATRELRDMSLKGELQEMPSVVACSADTCPERRGKCFDVGMVHYLEKPIARDALLRLISRLCPLMCRLPD